MKQFLRYIIVICAFSFAALTVNAGRLDDKQLTAYPNPIDRGAALTVVMPTGEHSEKTVMLYNTVGKVIHTMRTTNPTVEFNVPNISGIYLLRIVEKQKVIAVEKIVVRE